MPCSGPPNPNPNSILLPSNVSALLNLLYWWETLILLIRTLSVSSLPPYSLFHKAHLLRTFCSIFCTVFSSLYRFHSDCLGGSYAFRKQSQFWYSRLSLVEFNLLLNLLDWYEITIRVIRTLSLSSLPPYSHFFIERQKRIASPVHFPVAQILPVSTLGSILDFYKYPLQPASHCWHFSTRPNSWKQSSRQFPSSSAINSHDPTEWKSSPILATIPRFDQAHPPPRFHLPSSVSKFPAKIRTNPFNVRVRLLIS